MIKLDRKTSRRMTIKSHLKLKERTRKNKPDNDTLIIIRGG